ncbi:ABC transporter ATP-binding protein [Zavarzinia compransoris]|uniref:ABC transporter n=1 Tax=Zavarzinia compransoris TaxID=1264899 RepID=A0A317E6P4_9PROT|nr:ABC transporter ATP-binding protein [Zavarzinia compransoris]PWR22291.1 ABC transporter [Zavarzinia compransoris]TDP46945.1 ATP-binding cassette subfamily B protein [Zavarzinia compransoris]
MIFRDTPAPPPPAATLVGLRGRPGAFLLYYFRRHGWGFLLLGLAVVGAVLCGVGTQLAMKHLVDRLAAGPAAAGAAAWGDFTVIAGFIVADNALWRVGGWASARIFVAITGEVRHDLFAHLAGHAPGFFADRMPGTLASRVSAVANTAVNLSSLVTWGVLPPVLSLIGSIAAVVTVDLGMALGLGAVAVLLAVLLYYLAGRGAHLHRDHAREAAELDGQLVDVVSNLGLVRAFGATWRERVRIGGMIGREMRTRYRSTMYLENLRLVHAVAVALCATGLLAWALALWQAGAATVGDVVLVSTLGFGILHGSQALAMSLVGLAQHTARLDEALDALLIAHDIVDAPAAGTLAPAGGRVQFEGVRFAYPGRTAALDGLDLHIRAGERVGLVGRSGAGKSTVAALLQRFWEPAAGRILIDGQDIAAMTQDSLRAAIAVVPQDVALFHRTVFDNLAYARPEAPRAAVLAAAEAAQCTGFIEDLPDGFDTLVGDRGVKLSGGQRQRLAIARALLKDAPILVLDEATSALDSASEEAIKAALDRLMEGRTVIAIAHRLSTLRDFDRIVVMAEGRVVDEGSPAELAGRPGPFQDLLRAQLAPGDEAPL